jgi:hypothetical protein
MLSGVAYAAMTSAPNMVVGSALLEPLGWRRRPNNSNSIPSLLKETMLGTALSGVPWSHQSPLSSKSSDNACLLNPIRLPRMPSHSHGATQPCSDATNIRSTSLQICWLEERAVPGRTQANHRGRNERQARFNGSLLTRPIRVGRRISKGPLRAAEGSLSCGDGPAGPSDAPRWRLAERPLRAP